ncbi:alpha-L-fucosidase [Flavivirga amylovorans]|uniref:alpha-L-fucosidase n=1 Tax=Flavivirga amylovorans TaxID=870486 RepID=A0ABT8WX25_9FLAO|nr:alpha-L-fucosidase [Flavivirga amylovorans]MDO5986172.1 alpha-L-fucosidase [Flavivirga amylovorans]
MKKSIIQVIVLLLVLSSCNKGIKKESSTSPEAFRYEDNWESIRSKYEVPEWFRDAKFGIFINWGPYAVPAYSSEKYGKGIYSPKWQRGGEYPYTYHKEHYGDASKFGYKDLVPLFKAENFDVKSWGDLFKKSHAKYVVHVADYHDGFAMYNANHTRWNVANMGPKKDIMKMVAEECKSLGLKFGVSSHFALNRQYYSRSNPDWDTNDPNYYDLYGEPIKKGDLPTQKFLNHWWDRTTDVIDQYEPDLLWFDFGLDKPGFESVHKKILAYYYNKGLDWDKEVVFQDKNMKNESFPEDLIVLDIERGRMDGIFKYPWQTDTSVGKISWGHIKNEQYKSVNYLLDELIDIVSKNGCLLLNIGPKADGTIPQESEDILTNMGKWLSVNGEAIFETRPWKIYGEGPTKVSKGHHSEKENKLATAKDIRFTTKENYLYATALNWSEDGTYTIKSLAKNNPYDSRNIESVEFISGTNNIIWEQTSEGLAIKVEGNKPCEAAYVFKIQLK